MKRQALALLLHPFRNSLLPPQQLKEAVDGFVKQIVELGNDFPSIRLNIVLPGELLDRVDPLLVSSLREVQKRGTIEWLLTGHTEPFLSFSPHWLSKENLRRGIEDCVQLLGHNVTGFVPPFCDWEPSFLKVLRELELHYVIVSAAQLAEPYRNLCGYWATEHLGQTTALFPAHTLHHYSVPALVEDWLERQYAMDPLSTTSVKLLCLRYLMPLVPPAGVNPYQWLRTTAKVLDKLVLNYQTVLFSDYMSHNPPLGLQYLPPSLVVGENATEVVKPSANWLLMYDQVGILHRKMMEICDMVAPQAGSRSVARVVQQLFQVQDINRYLPGPHSGFAHLADRLWAYRSMIELEETLQKKDEAKGGQIRIADHLLNGFKSIIMSNDALKVYVDHRGGGTVYELDVRGLRLNLCAGYDSRKHSVPNILEPGLSRSSFVDHFVGAETNDAVFASGAYAELGNFVGGRFDYKVKKAGAGVKALLTRQGAILQGEKPGPLGMEKVFGLEGDKPELSFVYQLTNRSLTPYAFRFAVETTFTLPGIARGAVRLVSGRAVFKDLMGQRVALDQVTEFILEDQLVGLKLSMKTQKPVSCWWWPVGQPGDAGGYQGTTLVITSPVALEPSATWTLMGKFSMKRSRSRQEAEQLV